MNTSEKGGEHVIEEVHMNQIGRASATESEVSQNRMKLNKILKKCLLNFIQFCDTSDSVTLALPIRFIGTSSNAFESTIYASRPHL